MLFKKKQIIIEAIEWTGENYDEIRSFTSNKSNLEKNIGGDEAGNGLPQLYERLVIPTLEGNMIARKGDFIIKGIRGEFYPCKPDIFWQTYEKFN